MFFPNLVAFTSESEIISLANFWKVSFFEVLGMAHLLMHLQFTAHANNYLGQKKSRQIHLYRFKGTYFGYMGTIKKSNISTLFERLVVLRLKYLSIWTDWAEHVNSYPPKECWNWIFFIVPHVATILCTFGPI